ncbi:Fibronectin type III domain [[Eubacterium] siraeum 70/3]|uniref:Fibronectin type III domain n=1 Tax=[Eubacterium] siraeum 70/3 TaxID=657319 RepID=D4JW53_9FIRM|nr:Fibronectin type III domain [[Eubacterium] siraeum 70/3]
MKKKFVRLISAVLSAAMTLTAVPLSAFAEGEAHTHDGESNVITTPLDFREKTADENGAGWSWDYDTKTLTLDGVNIQATTDSMSVVTVPDGTEIVLNGNNTIVQTDTGKSDTYVLSAVNNKEVNCDGTMTISGDGVLNAENRSTDSMARSLGGSIILNGGTVNATGTVKTNSLEIHNDGVLNANATTASFEGVAVNVSGGITVDGNGSLTAVGCANESTLNSAILLTSNFGDKISVSENGSITLPEGNAARVGIYYSGNNGDGMDAEISGGKVTAYGTKYGIYKVNLIMNGTGSVYTTGGSYAIGQTVPTINEDEFVVKGSTEFKAEESSVTANAEFNSGYYEIGRADAKTVVIKPDTSPRIILGNQIGIFKTEEYEIIEDMDMTDIKLKGTVYFDITLKNMSDEEFADARGCFGGDEPDLLASIIKTDYGWVCMVCDTEFSVTYDTDNTLTIKCGDIVSNTVQVKSNANRFNKVTQGDNTNRTVFYTNTSQEEKDNYKLVSTYTVDSESISYNWYSTNSAYSADELGAAVSGSNGEFKLADNIPAGNYVLYCDITYSDGDSTETVTEKFTFTYKECAHENGYSDGKCTNCGALCDHSNIDIDTGKCNECAHQFVATISTDGNAPTGYDTLADCLNSVTADTENYVKIYQDIGDASATATLDTIDVKHNVMIDLNGHKLNNIKLGVNKLGVNKDVTLTLTGTAGSYVTQVYVRKGGGSFIIDSEANVEFNTIFVEDSARLAVNDGAKVTTEQLTVIASVNDDGTTTTSVKLATGMKLGGLTYHRQNNSGALKLGNLLDVTRQALRREDNGNYLDLYKEYGSMGYSVALTVVEHTDADHKYSTGTGKCEECGKPCEHGGDINTDNGICSICGAVVSVALYTDKNGSLKYVDTDELHSLLNEYNGSGTIKLFKDYSKPSAQYDLYGELTIDLNGRQFKIRSITPCKSGKLTIKNSGNPVMLGCNVYPTNDASYAGGTLIIDGDVVLDTSIYVYDSSTVILKAGAYPAGLYARDSKTLYDMLGEGKAFFKTDGTLFNANVKEISSSETLTIKDHSHTYVDGECGCGYVCPHSDVNSETGKCNECEYQYAAVIVKDGAVASVYKETEMGAAFEAADSDANTGCTLRVYKNYTGSYTTLSGKFTLWIAEKANVGTLTVSGDITVTGSGKNNRIYGDFNVAAGGKLTFDENCGAMGTVSVGAGTFDCYSTFSITLNINDASSDVILHGGAFKTICYNGGGDRANAEILTLLAENRMFMKSPNPEPIDGSKTLLKDGFATPVIVIPHEGHSYDSTTGKCTICGKRCGHTDVDSKTGVCSTCKYQLTAGISGAGTAKYFDNIDDAFTAALSAKNNGCTLTLYKNCEITQNVEIGNTTVTVDVNGCSLGGEADISVNNGGVLYLKDSRKSTYYGCIDAPFSVNGGTLINGTADGGSSAADVLNLVINSAKCVEIYGGIFENVYIAHASGVALYGGRYNTICGEESNTPVNALLAKGYAFAILNSVTHLPESIVDGSAVTLSEGIRNVTVVKHTHTYTETETKCACGAVLYAKVTSADGTTNEYFDSIEEGLLYADKAENKGCVFTLVTSGKINSGVRLSNGQFTITTSNYGTIYDYNQTITIDGADVIAEGYMFIRCKVNVKSGSLTLPEGSGAGFDSIAISGGTVTVSEGVNVDNNAGADNLFVSEDATDAKLTIGGGTYGNVYLGQFKLKDVIASGVRVISYDNPTDPTAEKTAKALLYSDIAEKNNFDSENNTVSYYLFTKCEHKNEDGSYAFNDSGICKYCNSEFAASVSYTVDGSAKTELFSNICDAFDKANEIGTATVTLYKDITDSERTQEITVMGNVTLELNGKTLGGRYGIARISVSDGGTLTVNGDGDMDTPIYVNENSKLVINGGGYFNSVSVKKGGNAEIGGGTIQGLSVRGNVKLSGGKFNDIEIFNGNLESVLADGYAYKNADGTWLSIDEREKDSYLGGSKGALSVEEAPIKSASISWAGGEAPVIYRNGAKKLKVNVICDVADTSKRITYSDYVNGNNRSKDSKLSVNWYMVFGYKIGEIVAEDGEVEYYTVLKCDGYEYKSNALKFTLATCSHPEDSFNNETDGLVFCGICDLLIEAEVVDADGKSLGYADIESAIKLAQENEGSTVKLISERVPASITVTGGKFTVDFNGKEAYCQFTVNGGDVTFTSSAVQDVSNQNLPSGITVNGTDAEVTIDGKIKLGRVRIISSTLTVNSTDGYIGELSIEGGNAVIDGANIDALSINGGATVINGANIDALKANGGDTVINDVNADSLAMCDNRSGGSEYNISIVSGRFGSFTCENGSNYTLGRAIASGSVVSADSMNGITVYTYEAIQTMTSTYRIFVDKCNHKDKNGSYVLDGNPCPYCNEEIVATVSYTAGGSENTDLFSDIYDAFERANEIGTATVTLQKNITDDITDTIAVTGNVTLELNGKRLSQPGTDVWYSIEVTSGKLTVNGSGLIKRVAVCNGSDAEINGGTLSDFIIKDGGNAVIKGGQFYSLQVSGEGRNVGQLLADGYAYWSFIDSGIWSTIAEREKQDIANVEVRTAPIKSATATANKTVLYRNGGGARQILFNFNVNTSDGYTISDANKVTVGLYVGDTLIRELDFVGNSYTFANADEISDTDGTVKAHLVIKLNGYEYVTDDVEFEMATCTHPYDALTTDEHDYYRCSLCDASINAILVKTNGDKACYTDNVPEAFEAAQLEENNGCTLELYRGVNRDCEITQGSFTVLFKKTGSASAVIKVSGGNVKITGDDGCTLSKYPGSSVGYLIAVTGGTVTFDDITINDDSISVSGGKTVINGGTYNKLSVSGGTVTINSGTFSSIDVSAEGKALKDLLGENKAFTTSDGKLFDASKVSESDNSLTVIDHSKHEYDETGRCGCGYQCAHSEINAEGVCNECNAKMYAAVTVKSETGTTVKYFTKLTEAFEFAAKNENKGCTLKMLRDFFDRNTDINVNGGELTVDMNGFGVYINSFNGSGTQITIRSDSKCTFGVENGFSMDGGTVTFSGEVSVVCQNVKLNATYFSSYVETLKIDTLILEDGVLLKQLASITNANIANIDCSSEIYLYQILASGSRVDSQLYSDLKANASSNFDNVRIIRCDHPDGVGRDNRCIYCNSLIAASVSYTENGAEKTEYFVKEDLGKAFAKANSVAIATITMLMSSAYDTDYLPVTGDVTLIANGDNAILYNTVKVADGGKLTLRGNANIFAVIAEPGSRLTAEEATRIAYLTVNGGDVKLSGGQYDNITVKDGKITDILGNGYAYKKTEGGAWLTLKEREVSEASGVTVAKAPIVQATLSTEMNKLYRNSNANSTLKFNLSLANGSNLNDSYVSKRYGINSYVSGDIIYSSLSALVKDAKLSADEIIDKAGDSDVAEIYFVVTTGDGYEIKSNTVSIDLVDCDHSQVVDPTADKETAGNITEPTYCEICESKFNAKITKGDDVKYYNNLDEAAKDAQKSENEGCTLYPLYNKNGYGGQLVITEGNFTLKYAVRTAFSRPIIINGKAKLTVTGRCAVTAFENQDAFIVQGGDVTFEGLATGSNVTINGGNVTMAANNINCLTINGGNVSISSGGFAEIITNAPNKVIADYIDPGFWVQDRGTKEWIDIYSLNKATASSTNGLTVRLCPMQIIKPIDTVYYTNGYYPGDIPSLQINAEPWYSNEVDAKVAYQWFAIDENGYETVIEGATDRKLSLENLTTGRYYCRLTYSNATTAGVSMASDVVTATITECEHSGGEATCTEKAKCEICGAEYGEPLGHDYVVIKVVEPDYRNEGYSVFECTRCKDSYIGNRVPVKPIPDVEEIAVEKTTYNEVDISWKNISGVDGYYVECYVGNQWKQIGFSTDGDRVAAKLSGLSAGLKYKVRIAAYAGSFTAKFRCFYVDTVPSPVWNINTVKATDETVRISWSRNARADGYKVEWYINNQWSVKTVTGNNNISAVIDGLCAGTRYKVRVSAYKGDLYSPYTYGYIDTLPSKVTGITKTVTSSSFTLKWDKNESADGYTAQYYADGKWNEKTLTGNNKTTVTIGSLKGYKTYKVRIKAYKGELESAFDDIYITTAPTKVSGLKVKSAVDSKAVVIWNADANADGYNVEYYIGGKWVKKTITDNKTAKAVLGGLTPYSTCKVRVRAYKDNLYGDYSYTTVTAVLSPVTNIKVVSAKSNSITVKWGKNASADGYKVEIYKGGKWVKKTLKGSTNATVTIGGLRAGSVYKVRIASYKGANTSTYTYANVKTAK